ncbi:class I SAM-dependent methyltransferase [Schinkia azotoformans]|uniref:class I SAM-dependent methyltransferase n=1 Tax=Schinkia azotoformans TaxID=1454 RepID=UPI002E1D5F1D|nr:class I SAM-dependent methyltransferase [Schinkia azotoformans]
MNLDPFYDELEIVMKETLPLLPKGGNVVLDIGCGKGWLTRLLYENLKGNVIGIDKNDDNIEDCRNNAGNFPIEYKVMDMVDLTPYTFQNSYSFITCHNVLGYIPNPTEQLRKIYAWLQPDGLLSLVVRTPSGRFAEVYERSSSIDKAIERYKDLKMEGSFGEICGLYLPNDLIKMVETAAFTILNKQGLYSLEMYLSIGYKALKDTLSETEREEYFFQWLLCIKNRSVNK